MKTLLTSVIVSLLAGSSIISCKENEQKILPTLFGKIYHVDSVAGVNELAEPAYVALTEDSLYIAFGLWDYSHYYTTKFQVSKSLRVLDNKDQILTILPSGSGFWVVHPDGKRYLYSPAYGQYDSVYKHLRIINSQESLLEGMWKFRVEGSESKKLFNCNLTTTSLLKFTRLNNRKVIQLEIRHTDKTDTCFRRSFRSDGSSLLINDYDVFTPFEICQLDRSVLALRNNKEFLVFDRVLSFPDSAFMQIKPVWKPMVRGDHGNNYGQTGQ